MKKVFIPKQLEESVFNFASISIFAAASIGHMSRTWPASALLRCCKSAVPALLKFRFFKLFGYIIFLCVFSCSFHLQGKELSNRKSPERVTFSKQRLEEAKKIKYLIIIFQENWSFDSLFGTFPGANGLNSVKPEQMLQIDLSGHPYPFLLQAVDTNKGKAYSEIPLNLPNAPFDLSPFIPMNKVTSDLVHRFYQEQYQINDGMMNRFAAFSDSGGFVMSYYDIRSSSMGQLASTYVLCDNWFHSCYGGSMCGAIWLFTAQMPIWPHAPHEIIAKLLPSGILAKDGEVSPDGYAINDAQPFFPPYKKNVPDEKRVPPQTYQTIGDLLSQKGISWKWYAQGWNDAIEGHPDHTFVFHHQAPVYFSQFAPGTKARKEHLCDLEQLSIDLESGQMPSVSFVRSLDRYSQHPGDGSLLDGLNWCSELIQKIQKSSIWKECAIILTFDENGGRWDHVPPPLVDQFGPGTRVPAVIISPYAKKGYIDHTSYETVSILKFIEERWDLPSLSSRDAAANNILNAFDFSQGK